SGSLRVGLCQGPTTQGLICIGYQKGVPLLIGQNVSRKALILQPSTSPVSNPFFDHSYVLRQKNQWVHGRRYCQSGLHRTFSSVCYRRSPTVSNRVQRTDHMAPSWVQLCQGSRQRRRTTRPFGGRPFVMG